MSKINETKAPFSGDTFTQHSIRGTLTPSEATKRYNIHWLINHFGLIGNGKDGINCPNPIEPNQEFTVRNGGKYFYDPYTTDRGAPWMFFGNYCVKESNEAKAFQNYMEFCNLMYSNILLPVPQLPVDVEDVAIPWDRETRIPSDEDLERLLSLCTGFASIEALKRIKEQGRILLVEYPAPDGKMHTCFAIGRDNSSVELIPCSGEKLWDTTPFSSSTLALELPNTTPFESWGSISEGSHVMLVAGAKDYIAARTAADKERSWNPVLCMFNTEVDLPSSTIKSLTNTKVTIYTGHCSSYGDAGQRWLEQLQNAGINSRIFMDQGDQTLHDYCTSGNPICPVTAKQKVA